MVDVVVIVEEDFWFDDRDEIGVLVDGRVAGEVVSVVCYGDFGWIGWDGDDGVLFVEVCVLFVVFSCVFGEVVEILVLRFVVGVGERSEVFVNFDIWVYVFFVECVDE